MHVYEFSIMNDLQLVFSGELKHRKKCSSKVETSHSDISLTLLRNFYYMYFITL